MLKTERKERSENVGKFIIYNKRIKNIKRFSMKKHIKKTSLLRNKEFIKEVVESYNKKLKNK